MDWRKTLDQLNTQLSSTYDSSVDSIVDKLGLEYKRSTSDYILPALSVFSAGLVVGAALGVLFAPKSGQEIRTDLRTRMDELPLKGSEKFQELRSSRLESVE